MWSPEAAKNHIKIKKRFAPICLYFYISQIDLPISPLFAGPALRSRFYHF